MSTDARHPVFAHVYDRLAALAEAAGQDAHRRELLAGLSGRVVEVGAGNGLNFKHYGATVTKVVAVEPEDYLRRRATEEAQRALARIDVVDGVADRLPYDDESFDVGVASLVLCSVPDPQRALSELRRVIRPGGELRFYEHVRADEPRLARFQDLIGPLWRRLAGGCHPNRDTTSAIQASGLSSSANDASRFARASWSSRLRHTCWVSPGGHSDGRRGRRRPRSDLVGER